MARSRCPSLSPPPAHRVEPAPVRRPRPAPCPRSSPLRALHPLHRVVGHRIRITEVLEERAERRELAPNGRATQLPPLQVLPPGEHVRPGHLPELLGLSDPHEPYELVDVDPVAASRPRVVDVRKPLGLERHRGQLLKLGSGQDAPSAGGTEEAMDEGRGQLSTHRSAPPGRRRLTPRAPYCLLHPFFVPSHILMLLLITALDFVN
jgi:hypothetical protein